MSLLIVITFLLLNVFLVLDFLLFYIYFEAILLPMFILIGVWGSRERKVYAAYQFFLYTFFGSMFMLMSILIILDIFGSDNLMLVNSVYYLIEEKVFLWLSVFLSIAIKIPMFPLHIWLPEAHVEAPTVGSVILAGVLLKLGSYAILRFLFLIFSSFNFYFYFFINVFCILGVIYASISALVQIDIKKIIAYSSIAHMSFVVGGFFSFLFLGISGGVFLMFSHGIVASALFFLIGFLYDRFKTRIIFYFGGLSILMPLYSFFIFIFILSNISFPSTIAFIGESLILLSIIEKNILLGFFFSFSVFLVVTYSVWLFIRLTGGLLYIKFFYPFFCDLVRREFFIIFVLFFFNFFFGIFPNYFLIMFDSVVLNIFYFLN